MSDAEESLATHMRYVQLPEPTREFRFDDKRRWRFDFAWPTLRIAAEVEGGHWIGGHGGKRFDQDAEKYNAAVLAGWRVLRFTPKMIEDGIAVQQLERLIYARQGGLG